MGNVSRVCAAVAAALLGLSAHADNLVVNGFGEEGSSLGFPSAIFDASDYAVGSGSFRYDAYSSPGAGEMLPIEPGKRYRYSFYAKSNNPAVQARAYTHLYQYDIDGITINHWETAYMAGTTTELAADLNNGDTYIQLADASAWVEASAYYQRGVIFWDYTNSLGHQYGEHEYSRNNYSRTPSGVNGLWVKGSGVDKVNNRIYLSEPWGAGFKASGTRLSQNSAGGHFYLKSNFLVPEEWTYFEFIIEPSYFKSAAAFMRPGWLMNYGTSGSSMSVCGVTLEVLPDIPELDFSRGNVGVGTSAPSHKLEVAGTIRAEEIIVEAQPWPDYVFEDGYALRPLSEVEAHIAAHGRLPGMPPAVEVAESGVSIGESQRSLLEKVEELTLYMIEKDKQIEALRIESEKRIKGLEADLEMLRTQIEAIR